MHSATLHRFSVLLTAATVATAALGAQPTAPVVWTARPEIRIGNESDPNYIFESVSNILVGKNGEMIVVDSRASVLRRYDISGKHLANIGRRGSGPGEAETIRAAGMLGDTIWFSDGQLNRVTLFSLGGRVLNTMTLFYDPRNRAFSNAAPNVLTADGFAIATPELQANISLNAGAPKRPLVRLDRRNNIRDTLALIPGGHPVMMFGPSSIFAFQPFNDGALWRAPSNGQFIAVVDRTVGPSSSPTFRVQQFANGKDLGFDVRIPYTPRHIESKEIDSVIAAGNKKLTEPQPPTPQNAKLIKDHLFIPENWPPVASVIAGLDGTTWLECEPIATHNMRWRVLDKSGNLIATIDLPRAIRVFQADRNHIWASENTDDIPKVVRMIVSSK